jgi:bifunctional non-homologous end joining protein LigD
MEFRFGEVTVACTNVGRVVFPDAGITKGDVLAYYRDVASVAVPHLRGRALTIERFTKGLAGGGFFQKHYQKHFPPWIDRVELGTRTPVVYPVCDTAAALVYFANQGALAFHVGTSRRDALDRPDHLVFDLDPPEGRFDLARRAAQCVRDLMEELELSTFVKTTGSKGLHVVVPLDGHATFDEVGAFCQKAAALLCARHAELFTTEFYKKDRGGRLFLDTMRNAIAATVIAPYSLRGRRGAPVAAPIEWAELADPSLAPDGVRLHDVRANLDARGDPWADLHAYGGSLAPALAELERVSER